MMKDRTVLCDFTKKPIESGADNERGEMILSGSETTEKGIQVNAVLRLLCSESSELQSESPCVHFIIAA